MKGNMENEKNYTQLKDTRLRTWLYVTSAGILLAGIVSAVLIYVAAMNNPAEDSGYEVIGGFVYPAGGVNNKKYIHDLQLYGGNAAMLGDRFMRWFAGLWHGTSLSYTVACIAFLMSFVVFVVANNVSICSKSEVLCENNPDKSECSN